MNLQLVQQQKFETQQLLLEYVGRTSILTAHAFLAKEITEEEFKAELTRLQDLLDNPAEAIF